MKNLAIFSIFIILIIIFSTFISLTLISATPRINEIEPNPSGPDKACEWIELYSKEQINLKDYKLINNDEDTINLTQTFQGYLIISFEKQWLDNSDEKVTLIDNNNQKVHETIIFKDSANNDKTWQYCNNEYVFIDSTKNNENNCNSQEDEEDEEDEEEEIQEDEKDEPEETTQQPINNPQTASEQQSPQNQPTSTPIQTPITNNLIQLTKSKTYNPQTEDIKTQNNILYQSKNELIKKYSVYGFAILCALLCILLAFKKL